MTPVSVGQLFPATDRSLVGCSGCPRSQTTSPSFDHHLRDSFADLGSAEVTYFRLIVVRVYEGEVVVKGKDAYATVASFLTGGPTAIEPCSRLRRAYRRDLTVRKKAEQSEVERTFSRARHLMVHYPTKTGELSGILQHARRLDARVWRDEGQERQRHLWPQDVMEDALWPRGADHRAQGDFAHELTRAFVDVFRYALPPYLERQRVSAADLTWVEPPPEDVRHERSTQAAVLASP